MVNTEGGDVFLGVSSSLSGARWVHAPSCHGALDATQRHAARLTEQTGAPPAIAMYLASRGIEADALPAFLEPTLRDMLPDPFVMQDVSRAANRLADAVMTSERVGIFGDYDVDGACAAAICARTLTSLGCAVETHIPDRFSEGYGPNIKALESLSARGCSLILTVDCGITAHAPLAAAKAAGMDIIVIDHHLAGPLLPEALAVVNPNRLDDDSTLGNLCAAGVCFMVMIALLRKLREADFVPANAPANEKYPDLRLDLDLVALATICDVVPLTGLNRAFVKQGLKMMCQQRKQGLNALAEISGVQEAPSTYALGFQLGPRINAGGRLGHSDLGVKLLTNPTDSEAYHIAEELNLLNAKRRDIEAEILQVADLQAETMLAEAPDLPALILSGEGWHEGVIGIVAGRLKDKYNRPCIVIAIDAETQDCKGSARGVSGIRLGDLIVHAVQSGLLRAGGGHNLAAGLSLKLDQLPDFRAYMLAEVKKHLPNALVKDHIASASLSVGGCNPDLVRWLDEAGPYGAGAPEPRFVLTHCRMKNLRWMGAEKQHFSCNLDDGTAKPLRAVAFGVAGTALGQAFKQAGDMGPLMILGKLRKDTWRGGDNVQFQIEDVAHSPLK